MTIKNHKTFIILTIGSIPLMMTLGNSMLIPILPNMESALDLSQMQVSLTITVFSIASALFIPLFGYLSDRFTRKVVILPSLTIFGLGGFLAGISAMFFSHPYIWILIGRTLQGIGAAGAAPIAMALTGDLFKGDEQSRVLGIFEGANGLGKILSPIFGSLLGLISWYFVFLTFPLLSLISIVLVIFFIQAKGIKPSPPPFKKYLIGLKNTFTIEGRWLIITYIAGGTCLFVLFGILFYLSNILEDKYEIEGVMKGLILAIPLLFMVTSSYMTGQRIGKRLKVMKKFMLTGLSLMTLSYTILIFFERLLPLLLLIALGSIGAGFILPCINSLITGAVNKERRGFVTSLYNSARFIGVATGPPIFTKLMEWSHRGMFISIALFITLIFLLVLFLIRVDDDEETKQPNPFRYHYF